MAQKAAMQREEEERSKEILARRKAQLAQEPVRASDYPDAPWAKARSDSVVEYALRDADVEPTPRKIRAFAAQCHESLWATVEKRAQLPPLRTTDFTSCGDDSSRACTCCQERPENALLLPCSHKTCLFCVHERAERAVFNCAQCGRLPQRVMRI